MTDQPDSDLCPCCSDAGVVIIEVTGTARHWPSGYPVRGSQPHTHNRAFGCLCAKGKRGLARITSAQWRERVPDMPPPVPVASYREANNRDPWRDQ